VPVMESAAATPSPSSPTKHKPTESSPRKARSTAGGSPSIRESPAAMVAEASQAAEATGAAATGATGAADAEGGQVSPSSKLPPAAADEGGAVVSTARKNAVPKTVSPLTSVARSRRRSATNRNEASGDLIERFVAAQDGKLVEGSTGGAPIETAFRELLAGRKNGHWVWYVLPQFRDERRQSANSTLFQVRSLEEGQAYLGHPVLMERLYKTHKIINTQLKKKAVTAKQLMGTTIDAKKLHQSTTTFHLIASHMLSLGAGNDAQLRLLVDLLDANLELIRAKPYRRGPFEKLEELMVVRMQEELQARTSIDASHCDEGPANSSNT